MKKPRSAVLLEYKQSRELNKHLKSIVDTLVEDYPHLADRLEAVSNTLNIHSPDDSPRLIEDPCLCLEVKEEDPNIPEKLEKTAEE